MASRQRLHRMWFIALLACLTLEKEQKLMKEPVPYLPTYVKDFVGPYSLFSRCFVKADGELISLNLNILDFF